MSQLALYLLGSPRIESAGEEVRISRRKALALLAYLAVTGQSHTRDALATLFWPEKDQSRARNSLRSALVSLRKAQGQGWLEADRENVGLSQGTELQLDVTEFRNHLAECQAHGHPPEQVCPACLPLLGKAAELYRGDFMAGFTLPDSPAFDEWQFFEREALRDELAGALERLVRWFSSEQSYNRAIGHARRWVALDPLAEAAHRCLMTLYAESGQRNAALRQYAECVRLLKEELGAPPSAETKALYERITAGEPEILTPPVRTVRGYELRERIGSGGFGEVYRAYQPAVARDVAVKVILPRYADHPEFVRRFETEAQLVARLEHPHIVPLYDYWRHPEGAYLVMRWLRGGNLHQSLQRGPWSPEAAMRLLDQIADALTVAHHQGVVHRDIKPANILLDEEGNAYLSDFGIAKDLAHAAAVTDPEAVPGSLWYISPEQAKSEPVTPQSDVYSLGIVMYEVLTGEHPFSGLTPPDQLIKRLTEPLPPLRVRRTDLPAALDRVIQRATASDLAERHPDAPAFAREFREALSRMEVVAPALSPAPSPDTTRPRHNLPVYLTPIVGREAEMATIGECLQDPGCRLLTLIGPGGIGKTRLAVEAARIQTDAFADGVFFVDLAPLQSADAIIPTSAQALGFSFFGESAPRQQLLNYLRQKDVLLVMDNFEHLLAGVDLVTDMLSASAGAKILATSRERLGMQGEHLYRVTGLEVPDVACIEEASQYSAVQLFLSGARRVQAGLQLTPDIRNDVVRICNLVGGMPLGILLAASWVAVLTPHEIAAEIDQGLDLLETDLRDVPERQRSIRAVFDHSWLLLSRREQEVFQGLSVFRGGFTRQAAHQVTGASLRELMTFTHKSLLQSAPSGRFKIHGLLRQYAAGRLAQAPQAHQAMHNRHCSYYAALLHEWHTSLQGAQWQTALPGMDEEIENACAAWGWAAERGQVERLEQAVDGLRGLSMWRARYQQGERACQKAMEGLAATVCDGKPLVLAKVLAWLSDIQQIDGEYEKALQGYDRARAILASRMDDSGENQRQFADLCGRTAQVFERRSEYDAALEWAAKALTFVDETQPPIEAALVYITQAGVHYRRGDYEEALARCRMGLAAAEAVSGRKGRQISAHAYQILGVTYARLGELHQAVQFCRECLRVYHDLGVIAGQARAHNNLAEVHSELGDWRESSQHYLEALKLGREIGDAYLEAMTTLNLGDLCVAQGNFAQAASYNQQSLALWQELDSPYAVALLHNNMGVVALRTGKLDCALSLLETSLRMFEQIDTTQFLPELHRNMAEVHLVQGKLDDARACAERSLSLAQEQGARLEEGKTFRVIGQVHLARAEQADAGLALRQSLDILTDLNSVYELARTQMVAARLASETGRTEKAQMYIAQAIETFERLGAQADLAEAQAIAGEL